MLNYPATADNTAAVTVVSAIASLSAAVTGVSESNAVPEVDLNACQVTPFSLPPTITLTLAHLRGTGHIYVYKFKSSGYINVLVIGNQISLPAT